MLISRLAGMREKNRSKRRATLPVRLVGSSGDVNKIGGEVLCITLTAGDDDRH
jgi:hypothetical protein